MEDWGQTLLIAAIVIVLGWFTLGLTWNLRKGNACCAGCRPGCHSWASAPRCAGSAHRRSKLVIGQARSPFKQVTLLAVLEPRDIPWLWLMSYFQHRRRDVLIVRAQLQTANLRGSI
jgi:hypothetical protein